MIKRLLPLLLLFLAGCALPAGLSSSLGEPTPDINMVVTQLAATMQATPGLPAAGGQLDGDRFQSADIQIVIPAVVAAGASETHIPAQPPSAELPYWEIYPEYSRVDLTGYAIANHFHQPRIYLYPIEAYAAMNEGASRAFNDLQAILRGTMPVPERDLPFLPPFNAAQVFSPQTRLLDFQNGQGLRFLTQYNQGVVPASNYELFYTYQGLTADSKYYVAAILPVRINFLPETGDPGAAVPPGGFAFPDWNSPDFITQFEAYLSNVDTALGSANAGDFTPSLDALDAMIASMSIP